MICKNCGERIRLLTGPKKEEFNMYEWVHIDYNVVFCCNITKYRASRKFNEEAAEPSKEGNVMAILKAIDEV